MFKFYRRWKKKRIAMEWFRGWDFAAGHLLSHGEKGIDYLQNCVEKAKAFNQYTPFDKGIESALIKYATTDTFPQETNEP